MDKKFLIVVLTLIMIGKNFLRAFLIYCWIQLILRSAFYTIANILNKNLKIAFIEFWIVYFEIQCNIKKHIVPDNVSHSNSQNSFRKHWNRGLKPKDEQSRCWNESDYRPSDGSHRPFSTSFSSPPSWPCRRVSSWPSSATTNGRALCPCPRRDTCCSSRGTTRNRTPATCRRMTRRPSSTSRTSSSRWTTTSATRRIPSCWSSCTRLRGILRRGRSWGRRGLRRANWPRSCSSWASPGSGRGSWRRRMGSTKTSFRATLWTPTGTWLTSTSWLWSGLLITVQVREDLKISCLERSLFVINDNWDTFETNQIKNWKIINVKNGLVMRGQLYSSKVFYDRLSSRHRH